MLPQNALETFRQQLAVKARSLEEVTPAIGIQAIIDFYSNAPAQGCEYSCDADMLLFQWGTCDWGNGDHFELDITRQLMWGNDDEEIWHLSLTYSFPSTEKLSQFGKGEQWCGSPAELAEFERFIRDAQPYANLAQSPDGRLAMRFERAG